MLPISRVAAVEAPDRASSTPPRLSMLTMSVYLPTVLFSIGQGAVIPVVAFTADTLGASAAVAATIVGLRGLGMVLSGIPAGQIIDRIGERGAMSIGTALVVLGLFGCMMSSDIVVFALSQFVIGGGWAVWQLARLTFVSNVVPIQLRGRALSALGGAMRIGTFIGPFVGALAIASMGDNGVYLLHIGLTLASLAVIALSSEPEDRGPARHNSSPLPIRQVLRENAWVFRTAGVGALCLSALRASRAAILPLWGAHIGLDAAAVSLLYGLSAAIDMTLFYPAGLASDRLGRKAVAVPCLALLALGFLMVPWTSTFVGLLMAALAMGVGNGLGSGIVMTLGADFAPSASRAPFLGVWRVISDLGTMAGPLLAGAVAGLLTLGAASVAIGVVGLAGAAVFLFAMPETLPPEHRTRIDPP